MRDQGTLVVRGKHKSRRRSVPTDSKPRANHHGGLNNPNCAVCHPGRYAAMAKHRSDR